MNSDDLDWLVQIEHAGSLSAAAKARGVSVSTVARRIDVLEASLRLRLVDRRRNGARLTPAGHRIVVCAADILSGVDRLQRIATAIRDSGGDEPVVVSATELVVSDILAPALPALAKSNPGLKVELRSQAAVVSLAGRQADLAVRMSAPEGASLVAKKLIELRLGMFASSSYMAGRDPAKLDLRQERLLVYDESYGRLPEIDWLGPMGLSASVAFRTNSTRALLNAAVVGGGIASLPAMFAEQANLVEVKTAFGLPPRIAWLVTHSDLRRRPEIRMVHRWIVSTFASLKRSA